MFSYWEQESFLRYNHIVIGAGIVGLSVALELKALYPNERILVLERGILPTGASTRNAGFACMGSVTELLDDLETNTEANVLQLFEWRKKGLELLRARLGDGPIGYAENGSFELISEQEVDALEKIEYLNKLLQHATHKPAFRLANDKIDTFGFSPDYTKALIENTCEGELHSGKMMRALTDLAISRGIEIKTGANVKRFEDERSRVTVFLEDTIRKDEVHFYCDRLTICTNAFTKALLPDVEVIPGRGQVLITEPIPQLKFKGIYHFDKGYYYFRVIDDRILLGGGRNLDFKTEETADFDLNNMIQASLEQKLREVIIPDMAFEIAHRWTGIMAFGSSKIPIVQSFSDRVTGAFRMGGMGVALGSYTAQQLAAIVAQSR